MKVYNERTDAHDYPRADIPDYPPILINMGTHFEINITDIYGATNTVYATNEQMEKLMKAAKNFFEFEEKVTLSPEAEEYMNTIREEHKQAPSGSTGRRISSDKIY